MHAQSAHSRCAHLWRKAAALPSALAVPAPDDLGLSHQHIHEVSPQHQIKHEVEVVLVLEAGVLSYTEHVGRVACYCLQRRCDASGGSFNGALKDLKVDEQHDAFQSTKKDKVGLPSTISMHASSITGLHMLYGRPERNKLSKLHRKSNGSSHHSTCQKACPVYISRAHLLTEDMLWTLHNSRLAHALECVRPLCGLLCTAQPKTSAHNLTATDDLGGYCIRSCSAEGRRDIAAALT